ncbi:hypothetical protein HR12_45610, partial [Microbacterium sp. SUBG005]
MSAASQTHPLLPGDLLLTGSPAGNGQHWKEVPARRRRHDGDDRRARHAGRAVHGGRRRDPSTGSGPDTQGPAPSEDPVALDRQNPEAEIAARAEAYRNWGRWGEDDVLGTLNFIDDKRRAAAALVRDGVPISLSQPFDTDGPQKGWRRRTNPVHTMTDTGTDAERGNQGFPHGIGGAD